MKRLALLLIVLAGSNAHARDHTELVCSGVASTQPERTPIFIRFFEHRANDGESRVEKLSTIYQDILFTSTWTNKTGEHATDAPITLKNGKRVRFRGTYTLLKRDTIKLELVGKVFEPTSKEPGIELRVTLPCEDLSI